MDLTKKHKQVLRSASRDCGMSYRSMCNRRLNSHVTELRNAGLIRMTDNGKEKGRFVFWLTANGKALLKNIEGNPFTNNGVQTK